MSDDLFSAGLRARLALRGPLADRMRPRTVDDLVGQRHLLAPGAALRSLIDADRLSSVILWGPPGTGKTTLARVIANTTAKAFESLSAVNAGVKDVREVIEAARRRLAEHDQGTILFLDEVHRFNKAQQDALLPAVEDGLLTLVGATTENPYFEVNAPLLSRSTLFRLEALTVSDLEVLLARAVQREGRDADADALTLLADRAGGDARAALTALEVALALAETTTSAAEDSPDEDNPDSARPDDIDRRDGADPDGAGDPKRQGSDGARGPVGPPAYPPSPGRVTLADAERALSTRALRYGRDDHYDVISAFIKSIRGSDVDAGLYWLARMLAAGEDARFIARRLVILASEDIGMADPLALVVADATARSVEFVGLPEASLNLAQAVVHLATAPKSNRVALALWQAQADVRDLPAGEVPVHLRDAHYRSAAGLGHGIGYAYPHDDPRGWLPQQYRPEAVATRRYYEPSPHGAEAGLIGVERERSPTPEVDGAGP